MMLKFSVPLFSDIFVPSNPKNKQVKKLLLIAAAAITSLSTLAQGDDIKVKITGFVKADHWIDSRKNTDGVDGLFVYYPMPSSPDANGQDLNKVVTTNFSALSTRLRFNIAGPDLFGAKANAIVEADFTGTNDVALLRLRLANLTLSWEKSMLVIGQAWHPLSIPQFLPRTISLNTGAPFQCFNRNPQLTYTYKIGDGFKFLGSINYQCGYESIGPNGKSSIYLRNAVIPNLDFQLSKTFGKSTIGVAYDFKMLRPNVYNEVEKVDIYGSKAKYKYVNDNTVKSHSILGYYNYTSDKLFVLAKQLYGQNLTEFLMQGGFGVSEIDPATGVQKYAASKGSSTLINFSYGTKYRIGGTFGYLKNNGFTSNVKEGYSYGRALDLQKMIRIAPSFMYVYKNFQLGFEGEFNRASWGTVNYADKGKVINAKEVDGFRFLTSLQYNF